MVGLLGAETKLPGQISGGMRKRAGLARALVLDPQIILFDEPDSGLDPVRTAYLNQLIVDLNQQTDATFLIVTHDINTARTVPDNIGLLYHGHLAMFGPREMLLSSTEPVVRQFLNAQRIGPIGMAEEKDAAEREAESAAGRRAAAAAADSAAAAPVRRAAPPRRARARAVVRAPTASRRRPARSARRCRYDATRSQPACGRSGDFFAFCVDVVRAVPRRPFQLRELIQQAWFISSVSILPAALVSIPFGAVIALQLGSLVRQLGAQSFTGAASRAGRRARGRPDRDRADHRRRGRLGDLRRPRRAQDPRGAGRDAGARHRPDPAAGGAAGASPRCSSPCCSTAWSAWSACPAATSST